MTPWVAEGKARYERGDYAEAVKYLTRAIESDPRDALAYHLRGWARAHLGDLEGELADWSKAVEIDPTFDAAYADRAAARMAREDLAGALSDWQTALRLNPARENLLGPLLERLKERMDRELRKEGPAAPLLPPEEEKTLGVDRRNFLRTVAGVAVSTVALAQAGCGRGAGATEKTGVRWGMVIDLKRCVACKACAVSCKNENKTPPGVAYGVFLQEERGEFPNVYRAAFFRPCMQCENSSCAQVCPTAATYHRPDGIVAVDYDKCIGCRYCIAACPYGARSFDYGHDYIEDPGNPYRAVPSSEYGAKYGVRRPGKSPIGNVRKCTFCLHLQDEKGRYRRPPACAATCMGRAIHFGDLADPEGRCIVHGEKLQELLARRAHHRLKEELGNEPSVYYLT
ncbi:MAG: tetratricopeptide repeat protein [Planctomycetota bacterium]